VPKTAAFYLKYATTTHFVRHSLLREIHRKESTKSIHPYMVDADETPVS